MTSFTPYGAVPSERQMEWYRRDKSAFFHFTVNTFTGKEWGDGTESPSIFVPSALDCRQWIAAIRKAGFSCAILTAKHHDGFCLWPSRYTEHSVKNSPFRDGKGDVVREFTDACREYGVKVGLYLSPWDRNHPLWGTAAYSDYYANQLTELMTEYGEIHELWWDCAGSEEAIYEWDRWAAIIRHHQPNCVIFGARGATPFVDIRWVGNEAGTAGIPCYGTIDESSLLTEIREELNHGKPDGERFLPAECDVSIRPGWFYHPEQDALVKTPNELVDYWFRSVGRNAGILLNLPIDPRGLIHENDVNSILAWQERLTEIFADNRAERAALTSDSTLLPHTPDRLIDTDPALFYAADALTPTVTVTFDAPQEINCLRIEEVIELGHRVRAFAVDYRRNGQWLPLLDGACIGFTFARYFPTVRTDALRLRVTEAVAPPLLRFFGAYHAPEAYFLREESDAPFVDLTAAPTTKITPCEGGYEIDLGGIFPYNKVVFHGKGVSAFTILAFNGSTYDEVYRGTNASNPEVCYFKTVEGSYKLKLLLHNAPADLDPAIRVCRE